MSKLRVNLYEGVLQWIVLATVFSLMAILVAGASQFILRQNANDPQIQLVEDGIIKMERNEYLPELWGNTKVDISQSLATYMILFDENGNPIASTGELDGSMPTLPKGVFEYTKTHGEHRFTWQPRSTIRMAIVLAEVKSPSHGFIAAGRSLKEVEDRKAVLLELILIGWAVSLFITGLILTITTFIKHNLKK